jgi:hypothetical protein
MKAAVLQIGDMIIIYGHAAHAQASDEDPAVVNSVRAVEPSEDGGPTHLVNATMFPEGLSPRNVVDVPMFASAEDAKAYRATHPEVQAKPGQQDINLLAFPKGDTWPADPIPEPAKPEKHSRRKKGDE